MKKRTPNSHRDFTYTERNRDYGNQGLGIVQKPTEFGGMTSAVPLPPAIVFRAPLGNAAAPEGRGRRKK